MSSTGFAPKWWVPQSVEYFQGEFSKLFGTINTSNAKRQKANTLQTWEQTEIQIRIVVHSQIWLFLFPFFFSGFWFLFAGRSVREEILWPFSGRDAFSLLSGEMLMFLSFLWAQIKVRLDAALKKKNCYLCSYSAGGGTVMTYQRNEVEAAEHQLPPRVNFT